MNGRSLFLACLLLVLAGCGGTTPRMWEVEGVVSSDQERIGLLDENRQVVRTVRRDRIQALLDIKSEINAAAGSRSELVLMEGEEPNAFAGRDREGRAVVAVNFGMLELLGQDRDAAAFLLGHEVGHLVGTDRRPARGRRRSTLSAPSWGRRSTW